MWKKVFKQQIYYFSSVIFITLEIFYFAVTINQPYVGLRLGNVNEQWLVISTDPYGEGYQAGVRAGDVVLNINGDEPDDFPNAKKWNRAEGATSITIFKPAQTIDSLIQFTVYTDWLRNVHEIPLHILGFIFWLFGFLTWYKRPFLTQARSLFWFCWIVSLAIVFAPASGQCTLFGKELEYISLSLLPIFLIHLVSLFPKNNRNQVNQFFLYMFGLTSIIIITFTILQSNGVINNFSLFSKLAMANLIIALLIALISLGLLIKLPQKDPAKNQTGIIFLGIMVGFFPFVVFSMIPQIFNIQALKYSEFSALAFVFVPISWHYVIVNKYAPNSRKFLESTVLFILQCIIISFIGMFILYFFNITSLNPEAYFISLALCLIFMLLLNIIRFLLIKLAEKFAYTIDRQNLNKKVLQLNKLLLLIDERGRIINELITNLEIEGALILIKNGKGEYWKEAAGNLLTDSNQQARLEEFFSIYPKNNFESIFLPKGFPAEIYTFIIINEFTCGIFFGHRCSHVKFEQRDLSLLTLVANQLAQHLVKDLIIEELSEKLKDLGQSILEFQRRNQGLQGFTNIIFRNIEKERKLISSEIHDGPLQLVLELNRWLKNFEKAYSENDMDKGKNTKTILYMREIAEELKFELRSICNDLRPKTLNDLGLFLAIENLCRDVMKRDLIRISLDFEGISQEEHFEEEVELAVYRFIQEGISNAVKHSKSEELRISLTKNEFGIELTVSDLGIGFDAGKLADWSLTGVHLGLSSMKERIKSLGGDLQISSTIGKGTTLKASIPINAHG